MELFPPAIILFLHSCPDRHITLTDMALFIPNLVVINMAQYFEITSGVDIIQMLHALLYLAILWERKK